MRSLVFALIIVATVTVLGGSAFAQVTDDYANAVPALAAYSIGPGDQTPRATLYTNTTQTASRYNPSNAAPVDNRRRAFDDVPIPVARLGGFTSVDLSQVSVGIRQIAGAPATILDIFIATVSTGPTPPDTELDSPGTLLCTGTLPAAAASVTTVASCGNGSSTIATVPLNMSLISGFGTFAVGVRLGDTGSLNGWRLTSGPDANADVFWQYDPGHTGQTSDEASFNFGGAPTYPAATFYISVLGTPSPEPASVALLGLGALMLLRRRR